MYTETSRIAKAWFGKDKFEIARPAYYGSFHMGYSKKDGVIVGGKKLYSGEEIDGQVSLETKFTVGANIWARPVEGGSYKVGFYYTLKKIQ